MEAPSPLEAPPTIADASTTMVDGKVVPTGAVSNLPDRTRTNNKEKVVVLGSGWASVKFVQNIDTDVFDVTVVSPRNFFLFSPFLPSVTVGSVEGRSIVEPMRSLVQYSARPLTRKLKDRLKGRDGLTEDGFEPARFLEVACTKIDTDSNRIYCEDVSSVAGDDSGFTLTYDRLVVAVGAVSNTFNTPGVKENALFLKEIDDATVIRSRMLDAFETASLEQDKAKMKSLLEFVVVGAGPTGVEFAAELDDLIREDLVKLYPEQAELAEVVLVSSTDDLLSSYDKRISDFTAELLKQSRVVIESGVRVVEVKEKAVVCKRKATGETFELPSALTLWSTGVKPLPLVEELIDATSEQVKRSGLYVDSSLKAYGLPKIYAAGDCAAVATGSSMRTDLVKLFAKADADGSGTLTKEEVLALFDSMESTYPQAAVFKSKVEEGFEDADVDDSGELDQAEFGELLQSVDSFMRNLPPTAQVAGQQGSYLASQFNGENDQAFKYFHKGSMAYIGQDKAAAQVSMLKNLLPEPLQGLPLLGDDIVLTGSLAELVWKFLYLDMQISNRNKLQVAFDWVKTGIFGRDTSRY
jgi:NADH:ubiquinone reductase (non-electrogenic)